MNINARQIRHAFTLIEMVLSMAVLAIIMGATASVAAIVRKASAVSSAEASSLRTPLNTLADDLAYATSLTSLDPTAIDLTIPDRTGDGMPDTISYRWSGIAGAPLTRSVNGATATNLVGRVKSMSLAPLTVKSPNLLAVDDSPETSLIANTPASPVTALLDIDHNEFVTMAVIPSFSGIENLISWKITRVRVLIQRDSMGSVSVGKMTMEICDTSLAAPSSVQVPAIDVAKASLPLTAGWVEIAVPSCPDFEPGRPVALVFKGPGSANVGWFKIQSSGANCSGATMLISADSGATWIAPAGQCLQFEVLGTYKARTEGAKAMRVSAVRIGVQASDSSREWTSTVQMLNQPEAP